MLAEAVQGVEIGGISDSTDIDVWADGLT